MLPMGIAAAVLTVAGTSTLAVPRHATLRIAAVTCTITGTGGDDFLNGTAGPDTICGLRGDDEIIGRGGADTIYAGRGNDLVYGGAGWDTILAGRGQDFVEGGRGFDTLYGGQGRLSDVLLGGPGHDVVVGGRGPDDLRGGVGPDVIRGGRGDDFCLSATDGHPNDQVFGGSGFDVADKDPGDFLRSVERIQSFVCFGG